MRRQADPIHGPMQFPEVTRLLLAGGADATGALNRRLTPLHIAAQADKLLKAGKEDLRGKAGSTAPQLRCQLRPCRVVRPVARRGHRSNVRMPSWDTPNIGPRPLAGATIGGHQNVLRLLLDRGAGQQ